MWKKMKLKNLWIEMVKTSQSNRGGTNRKRLLFVAVYWLNIWRLIAKWHIHLSLHEVCMRQIIDKAGCEDDMCWILFRKWELNVECIASNNFFVGKINRYRTQKSFVKKPYQLFFCVSIESSDVKNILFTLLQSKPVIRNCNKIDR